MGEDYETNISKKENKNPRVHDFFSHAAFRPDYSDFSLAVWPGSSDVSCADRQLFYFHRSIQFYVLFKKRKTERDGKTDE